MKLKEKPKPAPFEPSSKSSEDDRPFERPKSPEVEVDGESQATAAAYVLDRQDVVTVRTAKACFGL